MKKKESVSAKPTAKSTLAAKTPRARKTAASYSTSTKRVTKKPYARKTAAQEEILAESEAPKKAIALIVEEIVDNGLEAKKPRARKKEAEEAPVAPVKKSVAKKPASKTKAAKAPAAKVSAVKVPAAKAPAAKTSVAKTPAAKTAKKAAVSAEVDEEPEIVNVPAPESEPEAVETLPVEAPEAAALAPKAEESEEDEESEVSFAPRPDAKLERLQKILSQAGIASRRHAEELITAGRVQVNGKVVTEMGTKADSAHDHIRVDGKLLQGNERQRYFVLNKPKGYVTTVSDPEGRPTVMHFFEKMNERLYPVGRLDYLSEGLLLVTNDGDLANQLTRAGSGVEKTYLVKVAGQPTEEEIDQLRAGVSIERGKEGSGRVRTAPAFIRQVRVGDNPWFEVVLIEGRNRELRKMFSAIGHFVEKIRRVGYGPLELDIEPGKLRELSAEEVDALRLTAAGKLKPRRMKFARALPKTAGRPVEMPQDKKRGGKSFRPSGERPFRSSGDRPFRPAGDRPSRSEGGRDFRSSGERNFRSGDRPSRPSGDRPFRPSGDRPSRPAGDRPFRPAGEKNFRSGDRPYRSSGDRPFRPAGDRPSRPSGDRPFRPSGDRPSRPTGDRPFRPSGDRPSYGGPRPPRRDFDRNGSGFGTKSREAKPRWERREGGDRPAFRRDDRAGGEGRSSFVKKPYGGASSGEGARGGWKRPEGGASDRPAFRSGPKPAFGDRGGAKPSFGGRKPSGSGFGSRSSSGFGSKPRTGFGSRPKSGFGSRPGSGYKPKSGSAPRGVGQNRSSFRPRKGPGGGKRS